jgi:hypothetical protein
MPFMASASDRSKVAEIVFSFVPKQGSRSPLRSPTAAVHLMLIGYVCYLLAFQLGRGHAVCLVKDLGKKLDLAVHQIGT